MSVELHMVPVKAGDATLIIDRATDRSFTVLIDAGLANQEIVDYLRRQGIPQLDLVILSHPDLDHLQGLVAVLADASVSIRTIWCFDLTFLRDFVTTGQLPKPQPGTHEVLYERLLHSLVMEGRLLKAARAKGIDCLQVSDGHRVNLGSLHLEVLYPWDGFYHALRSPESLKRLLAKRWPEDWLPPDRARDTCARTVKCSEDQQAILENLLKEMDGSDPEAIGATPLAHTDTEDEERCQRDPLGAEGFPISLLGTLYNNLSIVVRIYVTGGAAPPTLLFPGDLTDWTYLVAKRAFDLGADVFKYPHHGSTGPRISRIFLKQYCSPAACYCGPWQGPELFCALVRPSHTLVFPYPDKLPKATVLAPCLGQIHANRQFQDPASLADRRNPPQPLILTVGTERHDIKPV